jgi:hypothetical protein
MVCGILHIRDVAHCWNSFFVYNGKFLFQVKFWSVLGALIWCGEWHVDQAPKRHILASEHVFWAIMHLSTTLRSGCAWARENWWRSPKRSHNRYVSMCPLKPAWHIGMELLVSVEGDDVIDWGENESDSKRGCWNTEGRLSVFPIESLYGSQHYALPCSCYETAKFFFYINSFINLTRVLAFVTDFTFTRVEACSITSFCFYPITSCIVCY